MTLGVYTHHEECHGSPWVVGKVFFGGDGHGQYMFFSLCLAYISANNRDIDTKLSANDPWGLPTKSRMSWMTLVTLVSLG